MNSVVRCKKREEKVFGVLLLVMRLWWLQNLGRYSNAQSRETSVLMWLPREKVKMKQRLLVRVPIGCCIGGSTVNNCSGGTGGSCGGSTGGSTCGLGLVIRVRG